MPRIGISQENKPDTGGDKFPKLKLDKDQVALVSLLEDPWMEWVHVLKAPKLGDGGEAQRETKTRKDGTAYSAYKLDFIGQPICLGDAGILQDKGIDPANCPACAKASSSDAVPAPIQRYAVNIIRYKTARPTTYDLATPFSAEILVWAFTAKMYGKLLDLKEQLGDLRRHDLRLKCEDGMYQRIDIGFSMQTARLASQEIADYVKKLWDTPGNRATDDQLRDACGRKAQRQYLLEDIDRCVQRWSQVQRAGSAADGDDLGAGFGTGQAGQPDLSAGIENLLDGAGATPAPAQAGGAVADPFASGAPASAPESQPAPVAAAPAPAPGPAPAVAAPAGGVADPFGSQPPAPPKVPDEPIPGHPGGVDEFAGVQPAAPAAVPDPAPAAADPGKRAVTFDELLAG